MPNVSKARAYISSVRNERAQIALEFVLIAGAILIIGVLVFPFATDQITLNKANAAARDGAVTAIGMFNIGYAVTFPPLGEVSGPKKPMRLTEAYLVNTGTTNNTRNYRIDLVIDFPDDETTVSKVNLGQVIGAQTMSNVNYVFSARWLTFNGTAYNSTVLTNRMQFSFGSITWN